MPKRTKKRERHGMANTVEYGWGYVAEYEHEDRELSK